MNSLLLKNWKLVLIVIGFALIVGAWQYDHAAQYKRGRESMAAEISGRLKDAGLGFRRPYLLLRIHLNDVRGDALDDVWAWLRGVCL